MTCVSCRGMRRVGTPEVTREDGNVVVCGLWSVDLYLKLMLEGLEERGTGCTKARTATPNQVVPG